MSRKIMENMEELQAEIKKLCEEPITYRSAERLINCHKAYKIMCEMYGHRDHEPARSWDPIEVHVSKSDTDTMMGHVPPFDRQMAMEWTQGIVNADGTRGPHFSMEKAKEVMKQYNVDCDPMEFWVVLNFLYSRYDQGLKKNNASTLELYACLAKAWIEDQDAVPNKLAAYYTYVMKH